MPPCLLSALLQGYSMSAALESCLLRLESLTAYLVQNAVVEMPQRRTKWFATLLVGAGRVVAISIRGSRVANQRNARAQGLSIISKPEVVRGLTDGLRTSNTFS